MCEIVRFEPNYAEMRFCLFHHPFCTQVVMKHLNEGDLLGLYGIHVNVHESAEQADFSEPFGAILFHQRVNTGYAI